MTSRLMVGSHTAMSYLHKQTILIKFTKNHIPMIFYKNYLILVLFLLLCKLVSTKGCKF